MDDVTFSENYCKTIQIRRQLLKIGAEGIPCILSPLLTKFVSR